MSRQLQGEADGVTPRRLFLWLRGSQPDRKGTAGNRLTLLLEAAKIGPATGHILA